MNVIAHNYPSIHNQSFFRDTIVEAFNQNIFVLRMRKHINSVYRCKANEINSLRIAKFVFAAHNAVVYCVVENCGCFGHKLHFVKLAPGRRIEAQC